ncbi:MAG: DUF6328 family protein [Nitrososphaeraceae archaeon]
MEKMPDDDKSDKELLANYDTILKESAILTTFSAILFGFLLENAINPPSFFTTIDKIFLISSLYSITLAACLFIMPVIYHHIQFPYRNFEKFRVRSHRFTLFGLLPAGLTLFLGLELALSSIINQLYLSLTLAALPFLFVLLFYKLRK